MFRYLLSTVYVIAATASMWCGYSRIAADDAPNVVLIVSDDHAWTDYGFMGHPHVRTPNIDRLASQSLTFKRGYVPSSLCCPSLATILTGKYPHQHKITSNDPPIPAGMLAKDFYASDAFREGRNRMNQHLRAVPVLPRILAERGYRSLQTGKWWQGDYAQGGFTHGMSRGERHGDDGLSIGRKTMQPIETFLDECQRDTKPFLLWYAPMMPHDPHTPPERILRYYESRTESIHQARYWAMIEWFDETVGELLQSLDRRGLADNTIVVYVADNGWIQDQQQPKYAPRSKQSPYDGGLRTPILFRWPSRVKPQQSDALAQSIDILPTLSEALGFPTPSESPGVSWLNEVALHSREQLVGACFTHNAIDLDRPEKNVRWRWIVHDDWKLIVPDGVNEPKGRRELYRIVEDPFEKSNVADQEPEVLSRLERRLDDWWKPSSRN